MAEKALQKLEDQLNCPICLDTYTDPKQLQCNHVYCRKCLIKLVFRDQQGQLILTCPNCRLITSVPASGVAGFQAAFQINQLVDIVEEHKKATASAKRVESVSTSPIPQENTTVRCLEHGGREVELYCETCEEAICFRCIMKDEKHHSHNYEDLNKAFEKYKEKITSSLEPMEKQLVTIKKALAQLDTRCEEISNQQATMEANIHDTFTRLHQTLDVRKTELIGQLHRLTQDKLKSLAVQRDQIETTQAQLSSCLHFMRENLKTGNQGEALLMKSTTVRQVKELTTAFQPDLLECSTKVDMTFSASADITAAIQNCGKLLTSSPYKIVASPFQVDTLNSISAPILTIGGVVRPEGVILNQKGEVVVVEGGGNCVSVFNPNGDKLLKFGQPKVFYKRKLNDPCGIAMDNEQCLLVSDTDNHRIEKFTAEGRFLTAVGTEGSGPLQFKYPIGIAYNASNDKVYVVDSGNCRVQILNSDLSYVSAFGEKGSGKGEFSDPKHLAFDNSGNVYVADLGNHRIQVFTAKGEITRVIGAYRGKHYGLAIDSKNRVFVSELTNNRVSMYTTDGQLITSFGRKGSGPGQFDWPTGLAVNKSGILYVCDYHNHRVQAFELY